MSRREALSFCRICAGYCGMRVTIDGDRIVDIHGDKSHPMSQGYACIKGLQAPEIHHGTDRLLHPLKRMPDGKFKRIDVETALDEIAAKLHDILAEDGADALAGYRGTLNWYNQAAHWIIQDFLAIFGSHKFFSTMTIDQSAKWVAIERLGMWGAGTHTLWDSDVWMLVGNNPLVSVASPNFTQNPTKLLKSAKERGLKLIVIDPRRTETARFADLFLQPYPGEDVTLAAGLLNVILTERWIDQAFCGRWVSDLDGLCRAVAPFTPDYVEARAGVRQADLRAAAAMFAKGSRGAAYTGTGPNMAPRSNLSEHLYQCLNVVCGRFLSAGERIGNPGVMNPRVPRRAEVIAPQRSWTRGPKSRIRKTGMLFGEMMTGILADEILAPGPGRIRALFVNGANPVGSIPDQRKTVAALRHLDLLVNIDPYMTETSKLAHYILPPKVFYEIPGLPTIVLETSFYPVPFGQYTPALIPPPAGSEVVDDWYPFWAIAKRLGRPFVFRGQPLDMTAPPDTDDLHAILLKDAQVPLKELRKHPGGKVFSIPEQVVEDASPGCAARFDVMPDDVAKELAAVRAESFSAGTTVSNGMAFTHRLTSRRMREVSNTTYRNLPAVRRRVPYNPAYLHPDDLAAQGLAAGARVAIVSDHGRIEAIVQPDEAVRPGVVSMTHGWGDLPDEAPDCATAGASTSLLISSEKDLEPINAMPRMSAIPVNILPLA